MNMETKELPNSLEAEKYLLSMCFQRDADLAESIDLSLRGHHFFSPEHAALYDAAIDTFAVGGGIVIEEFISDIQKNGKLDEVGGMAGFAEITGSVISSRSVKYWVEEIKDRYYRREIMALTGGASECATDLAMLPHTIAASLSNRALDVINEQEKPVNLSTAVDEALGLVQRIEDGESIEGELGLPTPIDAINRFLGMPRPGELITIAARPGGGKSSLLRGLVRHLAEHIGRSLFFSCEMPMKELVFVFAQEASGVSWKTVRDGVALKEDIVKFKKGLFRVKGLGARLLINDRDKTVDQLIARISASARSEDPLKAVAVDYLQRYDPQQQRGETRDIAIGRFMKGLKDAAIQHEIPVFLGAQVGRGSERESRAPRLSDLRESGNIEQDSDRVWFLWIPDKTPEGAPQDPNDQDLPVIYVQLLQAKGRADGQGKIDLGFHRRVTTFTEWGNRARRAL